MTQYFFADPVKTREHLPATPDPEALYMFAFLLDFLGWNTQQGRHDSAMSWVTELYQLNPDAFLKAIANGLAVIRGALDQNEPEHLSGIPGTLTALEYHCKTHIPENTQS